MSFIHVAVLLVAAAPERLDLTGRVTAAAGSAVKGANVMIYTARVRKGTNALCPSCYADCSKKAETDQDGSFKIAALDPALLFRVLVVAEGFRAAFAENVDPGARPITVVLEPFDPGKLEANRLLRGIVLDPEEHPVAGAIVTPQMFKTEEWSGFKPGVFDPLAVTNLRGEFVLTARSPIEEASLKIEARGLAPRIFANRRPRPGPQKLALTMGATVTGRLLKAGRPVADALMGLVQADRSSGGFLGALEIGTDEKGRFTFLNVAANDDYYVYGLMPSIKDRGALPVKPVRVSADGTTTNVGELALVPGHTISGRVILSDGKAIPPDTRLLVARENAWDTQAVVLDAEGKFEVHGLPTERYSLSIGLKGYHFSTKNHSIEQINHRLVGTIDQDIAGLKILLEPSGQ
jgi:hypothetical protein